jgi:hypothetical protein
MKQLLSVILIIVIITVLYIILTAKKTSVIQEVPGRVRVQTWDPEHRFDIRVKNEYRDLA